MGSFYFVTCPLDRWHQFEDRSLQVLPLLSFPPLEGLVKPSQAHFPFDIIYSIVYNQAMYSVKEAAQKLGISDGYCRWLLERGQIKGKKLGHDWVVLSLDYKRKRKPKGRKET